MKNSKIQKTAYFFEIMSRLGFSYSEAQSLRRIELTLHRWSEHECNGNIQRDGDDCEGAPRWYYEIRGEHKRGEIIADREKGALVRLEKIMKNHPELWFYVQGDPRGCSLYVGEKSRLIEGQNLDCQYSRGFGVCI